MSSPASQPTVLIAVSGPDRPGLAAEVFSSLDAAAADLSVLDVEQHVVQGRLVLAVLVAHRPDADPSDALRERLSLLDVEVQVGPAPGTAVSVPVTSVVTVLAPRLHPADLQAVFATISAQGGNVDHIRRLSHDRFVTVELTVSGCAVPVLRTELSRVAAARSIDVAVTAAGLTRHGRRLVVMDVDSTLITGEVIEMLAAHAGRQAEVAAVTEAAMRGELDFEQSLRQRVRALAGLDAAVLEQVRADVRFTDGARTLCRTLTSLGFSVALVSGGFHEIVDPLGEAVGARYVRANRLAVSGGQLTGEVLGPVIDRGAKAAALREFAADQGLPLERTVAIGDGANDLEMLALAGLGIAFNAKPVVREQADAAINVPYLDAVLHLLGINADDVVD